MCECDIDPLKDYVRKGRAWFVCPKCGKDITLLVTLLYELEMTEKTDESLLY